MTRTSLFLALLGAVFLSVSPALADTAGARRYNYATKKYEFYDGANWYNFNIGIALGGCAKEGEFEFNNILVLYQYCNGSNWIRLLGIPTLTGCSKLAELDYRSNTYMFCNGLVWVNLKGTVVL